MKEILFIVCFFALLFWCCKRFAPVQNDHHEEPEEDESTESYSEISEKIICLNNYKQRIDTINEMIADLMSCSPGKVHKSVSVKVLENDDEYDFLVSGEDYASELLLELLKNEREDLSTSLRAELKKIS